MFNNGLSLEQAPPIGVIMRFFFTVPIFGVLAGLGLLFADIKSIFDWYAPQTAAVVHLVLAGVAGMAMVGALFQMLPVIAGAAIMKPLFYARWIHLLLALGVLLLTASLYFNISFLMHIALSLLMFSLAFVSLLMLYKLIFVKNKTPSVLGMIVSLISLAAGLVFGVLLALVFMGVDMGIDMQALHSLHVRFMIFGWICTLVMAVAFQVVEMFYVTPAYPKTVRAFSPIMIMLFLSAHIPSILLESALSILIDAALLSLMLVFSAVTLKRLTQRKRPIADTTVQFWRVAMASLGLSAVFMLIFILAVKNEIFVNASALLFGYFILSIIFAMSYKIVPFLVWFHLNAKGVFDAPMMGDIVTAKKAKYHLWIHWLVALVAIFATLFPFLWKVVGVLLILSFTIYGFNIVTAMLIYKRTLLKLKEENK